MSSSLTDQQLRQRLQKYNFSVPPINESTRRVLTKKLAELEKQDVRKTLPRRSTRGCTKSSNLIDYSSAEEEATSNYNKSERPVKRISRSHRNSRSSTPIVEGQKSKQFQTERRTNEFQPSTRQTRSAKALLSYSENEEEDENEDESGEDEDNLHENDYDDEDGSEEEDEEDLEEQSGRTNFASQTSPGLDSSSYQNEVVNGGLHFRGSSKYARKDDASRSPSFSPNSNRFSSSTPLNPVPSTSLYMKNAGFDNSYRIMSSQLRAIANSKEFGSLGEVLNSMLSTPTSVGQRQTNGSLQNSSPVTQVSNASQNRTNNSTASSMNSTNFSTQGSKLSLIFSSAMISKMIIALATVFFLCLFLKYASLRPTPDIQARIPVCGAHVEGTCVEAQDKEKIITLFKEIVQIMDDHNIQSTCESNDTSRMAYMTVANELEELHEGEDVKEALLILTKLMMENPAWGIIFLNHHGSVVKELADVAFISLAYPTQNWRCWLLQKGQELISLTTGIGRYVAYCAGLGIVLYTIYKVYVWWREKKLQEKQEIYEMVEKVLSLLVAKHQAMTREHRSGIRPGVAVNHIRDELIPPADRKKKQKLWNQVVKYIKDSDSRVREDVQQIYGEEHLVWQWLPEFHWSPLTHPERPHPYTPNFLRPHTSISSPPTVMVSSPGSPHWQGPAFNSLNKNVASPPIAPTSCLKVRHLFDAQRTKASGWVWQVKEDVLKRCVHNAKILHIAVDTESTEGCVYIKALTTEDALNVFKTLHGQWYKGNLVTVKYLREERYFERFPDAKFQKIPLRPST